MAKTNIACAQIDCVLGEPETNRNKIIASIRAAADREAHLVIFPECALTGYAFNSLEEGIPFAEKPDGPSSQAIAEACRETGAYTIVGFIEADGDKFYNAAMLVGPRASSGYVGNIHCPLALIASNYRRFPVDRPFRCVFFLPWARSASTFGTNKISGVGAVLKLLALRCGYRLSKTADAAWRSPAFVANTRALENHVFYAAADRVGTERGWQFIGRSKVIDCNGDTLAEAGPDAEELLMASVELQEANNNHIVNVAGAYEVDRVKDRRPELYDIISDSTAPVEQAKVATAHTD